MNSVAQREERSSIPSLNATSMSCVKNDKFQNPNYQLPNLINLHPHFDDVAVFTAWIVDLTGFKGKVRLGTGKTVRLSLTTDLFSDNLVFI